MKVSKIDARRIGLIAIFGIVAMPAYAVDGVVLISQNTALAGNVTPGDLPGFPITIGLSGSYKLSTNLTVADANVNAIEIMADDVTIDLNGFSIIGPAVCLGLPPVCSGAGVGVGIFSSRENITILNGKIRGMGGAISFSGLANRVERVHAVGNAGAGISMPSSSGNIVIACTARTNAGIGIVVDGLAESNTAFGNAGTGISVIGSAINNHSQNNFQSGISGSGTFIGNTVRFNSTQGINASCRSTIVSNTVEGNIGGDIFTSGANCVLANNAFKP